MGCLVSAQQIAQLLDAIDGMALALQEERDRLLVERAELLAIFAAGRVACGPLCWVFDVDPGELRTRADTALTMAEAIEVFVGERLPRIEELVRAGDIARGVAALDAANKAFRVSSSFSPVNELQPDVSQLVQDIARDLRGALPDPNGVGLGIFIAAVAGLGLLVATRR